MGRVVHFEIHASNPESVVGFYTRLFGWRIKKWEHKSAEYWLIETGDAGVAGINGGLVRRRGDAPSDGAAVNAFVCNVSVAKLDEALQNATDLGATVAVPKMAIPGIGWVAYIKDPDGNILGMTQPDREAH